jgi:outer membrane lipoprotein-sorting protein
VIFSRIRYRPLFVLLAVLPLTGCLFRSRKVQPPLTTVQLKTASPQELVDYINTQAGKVQTVQATVNIDTSVGGEKKGKVTDYQQIRGYVMARKPSMLRLVGLMPIVRNRAFDMVSDSQSFKLWIPTKNRFVVGRNDLETTNATQPLENLRPQPIYDSLLLRPIDPQNEIAVVRNESTYITDSKGHKLPQANYVLDVIRKAKQGWFLAREIVFSRTDLLPHRQLLYDENGNVTTTALYEDYRAENEINFPWQIEIAWPQEEYDITLTLVKLDLNQPLPDDKFVLEQPTGVEVVHLDKPRTNPASPSPGSDK